LLVSKVSKISCCWPKKFVDVFVEGFLGEEEEERRKRRKQMEVFID